MTLKEFYLKDNNNTKPERFSSVDALLRHLRTSHDGYLAEVNFCVSPCDELILDGNGTLFRKQSPEAISRYNSGIDKYNLSFDSFNQLLSFLKIPVAYARRLPNKVLLDTINGLLQDGIGRNIVLRVSHDTGEGKLSTNVIALSGEKNLYISVLDFISPCIWGEQESAEYKFKRALSDNLRCSAFFSFRDKSILNSRPFGFEMFYSDGMEFNPTIYPVAYFDNGFVLFKNLGSTFDLNACPSNSSLNNGINAKIVDIYHNSFLGKNSMLTKLPEEFADKFSKLSSKMLSEKIDFTSCAYTWEAISAILNYQAMQKSLLQKRCSGFLAGRLIEDMSKLTYIH